MFRSRAAVWVGVTAILIAGCGSKLTAENYGKIQNGMTEREVTSILGAGEIKGGLSGSIGDLGGSAKVMEWKEKDKQISITFANGKVILKAASGL